MSVQPPMIAVLVSRFTSRPIESFTSNPASRVFLISRAMRSIASSQEMGVHSRRTGRAIERPRETLIVDDELPERDSLRAKRAAVDRVVGIAFDVDHRRLHVARLVTQRVNDDAARDGTVRADAVRLGGARNLEFAGLRVCSRRVESEGGRDRPARERAFNKISSAEFHCRNL